MRPFVRARWKTCGLAFALDDPQALERLEALASIAPPDGQWDCVFADTLRGAS